MRRASGSHGARGFPSRTEAALVVLGCLVAAWALGGRAVARGWERVATQRGPAPVILQVAAADLDGDGTIEVVAVGRDYERNENRVFILHLGSGAKAASQPLQVVEAGSPRVEPMSHVAVAIGPFTEPGRPEILVATDSRLSVWRWDGEDLTRAWSGPSSTDDAEARVLDLAPLHLPGEPAALAIAYAVTRPRWRTLMRVWRWQDGALRPVTGPFPIGAARSMTSGDFRGDGTPQLAMETGEGNKAGVVTTWAWSGDGFRQTASASLRDAPVFGLEATRLPEMDGERDLLLTADDKGRVALYAWQDGTFRRVGDVLTLGWGLVSAAVGDLDADGKTEAVVVEYPNVLHVLRWRP